jgi:mono/diheme cytochrome c family protein
MKLKVTTAILAVTIFLIVSCQSEENIEFKRYYASGAIVYQNHCQNCHGNAGEGLSALIPPLTDSTYLKNNKNALACYITSGLKGQISVKGKTFDEAMPANDLSPLEVAQVLTYIGNSFSNKLGTINEQQVQADLKNCR